MLTATEQPQLVTRPELSLDAVSAADVMSAPVVTVQADTDMFTAWNLLQSRGVHHLVVLDRGRVAGVVSEPELVIAWIAQPFVIRGRPVRQLLRHRTPRVMTEDPLARVADTLLREDLRAVPVVTPDGELVGVVTASDILRAVAERRAGEIPGGGDPLFDARRSER